MGGNAVFTRRERSSRSGLIRPPSAGAERAYFRAKTRTCTSDYGCGRAGMYVPELIIYHFVPTERLTKRYHRAWCFWQSVSSAVLDRIRPQPTAYVLGVPRYFYGRALRGMFRVVSIWKPGPADRFSKELALWELAGFFYGKHFYRPE